MVAIPTLDNFKGTTVMVVIRNIVDYLINTLVPGINSDIASKADASDVSGMQDQISDNNVTAVTIGAGSTANTIRIILTKAGGNVTSNSYEIEGSEITITQNTDGISINGTALQTASTTQNGLMARTQVTTLNTASTNAQNALNTANNITAYVGTDTDLISA